MKSISFRKSKSRKGAALLAAIFAMVMISLLAISVVDVGTTEMAITRNALAYKKALYIADAGVQEALARLRDNATYRGNRTQTFPVGSGSSYTFTVADGDDGKVIVTSVSTVNGFTKQIVVKIQLP